MNKLVKFYFFINICALIKSVAYFSCLFICIRKVLQGFIFFRSGCPYDMICSQYKYGLFPQYIERTMVSDDPRVWIYRNGANISNEYTKLNCIPDGLISSRYTGI